MKNNNIEPIRLAVFASGRGSNLESIMNNIKACRLDAKIVVVISNNSKSGALELAVNNKVAAHHISRLQFETEESYINHLLEVLKKCDTQLVILAGYMKKVPVKIIQTYKHRILNIHPALLPSFGGKGLYGKYVHEAVLEYGCKVSGATVHIVDEEYDTGPPVYQQCVPVLNDDSPETLAARILKVEHEIYPKAIQLFAEGRVTVHGRKTIIANP
ncbi:phosphoribosylglycinamide formyltransferase [candidate division KSB1 bacterium]|nr:phosphoribosylglycinamide formyltransferase [candidate division KSB1 bacterium]